MGPGLHCWAHLTVAQPVRDHRKHRCRCRRRHRFRLLRWRDRQRHPAVRGVRGLLPTTPTLAGTGSNHSTHLGFAAGLYHHGDYFFAAIMDTARARSARQSVGFPRNGLHTGRQGDGRVRRSHHLSAPLPQFHQPYNSRPHLNYPSDHFS